MQFPDTYTLGFTILAAILLVSAVDDLVPALICFFRGVVARRPADGTLKLRHQPANVTDISAGERRIAIFVPCWQESAVIGKMVRHNLASIRYAKFDFFLGVYANDTATRDVVNDLARAYRNVHPAAVPHDGPTSKADCLNWIYQSLCEYEERSGLRFDTVVVHDAEDLIHPDALRLIHTKRFDYDLVQVPVLPLRTGLFEWTHGIYCDEFAEFQQIDMPARGFSGSFLPSNGVGAGYSREVLERLAEVRSNRVFEPAALTEDYESGVRIHQLGFRQLFARAEPEKVDPQHPGPIATREYFPRRFSAAVRQRTRWVTGICLQGWERLGWAGSAADRYWFWRDRKALFTNPLGLLVSILMLASLADYALAHYVGRAWRFGLDDPLAIRLCWANLSLQAVRTFIRMVCVARFFGVGFALGVPLRTFYETLVNGYATLRAWATYIAAKIAGRPLVWLKTEHTYPTRATLASSWKSLEEVLAGSGYVADETLALAKRSLPAGADIGAHLVEQGWISEDSLWEALSLTNGVEATVQYIDPNQVDGACGRFLPRRVQQAARILPVGVRGGALAVASCSAPTDEMRLLLERYTNLRIEFRTVTPGNFLSLERRLKNWEARYRLLPAAPRLAAAWVTRPAALARAATASQSRAAAASQS